MGAVVSPQFDGVTRVLAEDPDLAQGLEGERLAEAMERSDAAVLRLPRGTWDPVMLEVAVADGIGLLVLDGLLMRRVGVADRFGAEILGASDVLRPWQLDDVVRTLPKTGLWRALAPSRLAVLDRGFTERLAPYPEVIAALFSRALRRASCAAVRMAIMHQPRVDVRLTMLLWDLADRWGRVRSDGVHLPLAVTHATLADLVAARRPTVSKALGELAARGELQWVDGGWLLRGDPPAELQAVGRVSIDAA